MSDSELRKKRKFRIFQEEYATEGFASMVGPLQADKQIDSQMALIQSISCLGEPPVETLQLHLKFISSPYCALNKRHILNPITIGTFFQGGIFHTFDVYFGISDGIHVAVDKVKHRSSEGHTLKYLRAIHEIFEIGKPLICFTPEFANDICFIRNLSEELLPEPFLSLKQRLSADENLQ